MNRDNLINVMALTFFRSFAVYLIKTPFISVYLRLNF